MASIKLITGSAFIEIYIIVQLCFFTSAISLECYKCRNVQLIQGSKGVGSLGTFIDHNRDSNCELLKNMSQVQTVQCPEDGQYMCLYLHATVIASAQKGQLQVS